MRNKAWYHMEMSIVFECTMYHMLLHVCNNIPQYIEYTIFNIYSHGAFWVGRLNQRPLLVRAIRYLCFYLSMRCVYVYDIKGTLRPIGRFVNETDRWSKKKWKTTARMPPKRAKNNKTTNWSLLHGIFATESNQRII